MKHPSPLLLNIILGTAVGLLLIAWTILSFRMGYPNFLIADEHIYFNLGHLNLPWFDFLFYHPRDFYGHGPLLPLIHKILFSLSPSVDFLRSFHFLLLPLFIVLCFSFATRKENLALVLPLTLFHPTLWAQSGLLFPELLQGILATLAFVFWKKEKWALMVFFLTLNILLRESSLAFVAALMLLDWKKGRIFRTGKFYFLPLFLLILHLTMVLKGGGINPGWKEYQSAGFWQESFYLLTSLNFFFPPIGGSLLLACTFSLGVFTIVPVSISISISKIVNLKKYELSRAFPFLILLTTLLLLLGELADKSPLSLEKTIYRANGLGLIGVLLFLILGISSVFAFKNFEKKNSSLLSFTGISTFLFLGFFLWYQSHAPREIIPLFILLVFTFSQLDFSLHKNLTVLTLLSFFTIFSLIPHFTNYRGNLFPQRILHFKELFQLIDKDSNFLKSLQGTSLYWTDPHLDYLSDQRLSPSPIKSTQEGIFLLSMHPDQKGNLIQRGETFFLFDLKSFPKNEKDHSR